MKIVVTGAAGFIGAHLVAALVQRGDEVVGLDNLNDYYDVRLKEHRLAQAGIATDSLVKGQLIASSTAPNYRFVKMALEDRAAIEQLFAAETFDVVCNLAAQAGVRYSIENPHAYVDSNVVGFLNILEAVRHNGVSHLVYASSSSVYGKNGAVPYSESNSTAHPVSLYAATKLANELMAHSYSSLYAIPTTGLRFFTVYGPMGRPDMAPYLFTEAIANNRPIKVYNNGDMLRDFTYIDDIIEGVVRVIDTPPTPSPDWDALHPDPATSDVPYRIYNIGNSQPIPLMEFIQTVEVALGKEAQKEFLPMQQGDVYQTNADTTRLETAVGFRPSTPLNVGVERFVEWYRSYHTSK